MTKDEMKGRISMALKDPVLQQGFEIICKNLAELEKEKCELLGIIQDKDKVIQELKKENAELDCQMNRNKFCYSCANATDRCFRNEIGCPCEKYKSYKGLNKQLTKAKEILTKWVELFKPKGGNIPPTPIQVETEQFLRELEE